MDEKISPLYHKEYYRGHKPNITIEFLKHPMFPYFLYLSASEAGSPNATFYPFHLEMQFQCQLPYTDIPWIMSPSFHWVSPILDISMYLL